MEKEQLAKLNYLRMAPRKVRLVADSVRGLSVNEAEAQLLISPRRPAEPILKLIRSAVANAKERKLDINKLLIKSIRVDQGPMLKRYMPRAMGRATEIQKKSSHVILVLAESDKVKEHRFKIVKPERIKRKELERIKKERNEQKDKPEQEEKRKEYKPKKAGFMKRIFRRKAV